MTRLHFYAKMEKDKDKHTENIYGLLNIRDHES